MTADGKLPPSERRNYKNIFDALKRLAIEEGRKGMFAGLSPTILRAMFANVTQLVSYTRAKDFLINNGYMEDDINCHLTSSVVSGMVYSVSTIPLDVAKTRIQQMKSSEAGIPMYSGLVDVFVKTVKNEGVLALWKGFGPFYVRVAPFTIILFVVNEQLLAMYKQYVIGI
uniref:Mitochondrial carrier protein n=2 Tax=Homalodisca TaxID=139475 RepID=A0A1B6HS11_9HEMI